MVLDKDELKKLSPEERIAKLRKLEDERKKELKEAEKLIIASMEELEELRVEPDEPEKPETTPIAPESELEQALMDAPVHPEAPEENVEYAINLYDELAEMAGEAQSGGYANIQRAAEIYDRLKIAETYEGSDKVVKDIAEGSRRLMKELFNDYKANLDYSLGGQ